MATTADVQAALDKLVEEMRLLDQEARKMNEEAAKMVRRAEMLFGPLPTHPAKVRA